MFSTKLLLKEYSVFVIPCRSTSRSTPLECAKHVCFLISVLFGDLDVSTLSRMTRKEYCVAIAEGDIAKVKKMSKRHLLGSAKRKKIPTLGCFSIGLTIYT